MHRLPAKGSVPKCLQKFCGDNPDCRDWESFYGNYPDSYKSLKMEIAKSQGYLCAYCEEQLPGDAPSQMRIEHFHPKEDVSTSHNWAFDWNNMLVTCHGGSRKEPEKEEKEGEEKKAIELHCDASKEQIVTPNTCEGYLLNPLTMPAECLFELNRTTGELFPNEIICSRVTITENRYSTVAELVWKTIRILGLNCDRLKQNRLKVIHEFEKIRQGRKHNSRMNKSSIRTAIAEQWFEKPMSFYTTRRILLGNYAEDIISRQ